MRRMAGGAGGSHAEAFLEKSFPMDTLRVVFQDVVLVNFSLTLDGSSLAMARSAYERDAQRGDR